jgi:predicted dehydrogenase
MLCSSKQLRIAVAGVGHWGPNLIRNFHTSNRSRVTAVCDQDVKRLDLIKSAYPDIRVTPSFEDLLNDKEVDAIVIATPTETHFGLARQSLSAGKHIFVEKPVATNKRDCDELLKLAKARQRHLFVGHVFVYNAGIRTVKNYIESQELGTIYYINLTRTNLGPIRTDVNAFWDLAPHDISILNYWFPEKPVSVNAVGAVYLNEGVADTVYATYRYASGMIANIHTSWLHPKKVREITVVGEKKMIVWNDLDLNHPIKVYDKNVTFIKGQEQLIDTFSSFHTNIHEGDTLLPKIRLNEPLKAECEAFLDVILDGDKSLSSGLHGAHVVNAMLAAENSISTAGREVEIDYSIGD